MARGQDDFSITTWDTHIGLPEIKVQALALRSERFVWVATEGGLCLFDGINCNPLPQDEASRFPQNSFTALLVAHDQSLWVGTEGGGLLHLSHGHLETFDHQSGLTDGYIRAIYEDAQGQLWVGTDYGLFRRQGAVFEHVPLGKADQPQLVYSIAEDGAHRLFVGGRTLSVIEQGKVTPLRGWEGAHRPPVRALLVAQNQYLVFGTIDGAFEVVGNEIRRLPFPQVDIESLCQSGDGSIWAGTVSKGLWRLKDNLVSRVAFGEGTLSRTVLAMASDMRGRLWVGTQSGLTRIEATDVHFVESPALAVDRETLAASANGEVNLINGRVYRVLGRKLAAVTYPIPQSTPILDVLNAKDHSVWLGTGGNGVYRVDPSGGVTQYSTRTRLRLLADYPRGIVEGANGEIWVATEFGVNVIHENSVKRISVEDGLPSRTVRTLFLDDKGCMWIGTDGGPAVACNGVLQRSQATNALHGEEVWAIVQDRGGSMWFGTRRNGLYAFTESGMRHLTVANGLPSDNICGLIVDRNGNLWASGLSIIFSIAGAREVALGTNGDFVIPRSYLLPDRAEGLRFTRGRFPNTMIDPRGAIWFASDRGAAFVDKLSAGRELPSDIPTPVIRAVAVDNTERAVAAVIEAPSGARRVTLSPGADYLGHLRNIVLMYRMKGVDDKWTIASNARQVDYNNLAAGTYWFELKAGNRGMPGSWNTASMRIVIPVKWYRSVWFYLVVAVGLLGLGFLIYYLRLRGIRRGFQLILEERSRVAREMHDTLIQGCNGVAMLLEAEASQRGQEEDGSLLNIARAQIHSTVSDARDALWNLRHSVADASYLGDTLKSIAAHATAFFHLPVELQIPHGRIDLPSNSAHELMMIVREAVTNAGTHASAGRILVTVQVASRQIVLEIADDGKGFEPTRAEGMMGDHFGIRGMRERAAGIGASLSIVSRPGSGTTVRVRLPLD